MDQYKDLGILRKVSQGTQTVNVVIKVDLELLRRDIEDEDQHSYILEDVVSLRLKVLLHKAILTATIPQGEHKVAKEAYTLFIDIYCECDLVSITSQIVRKDNRPHGCFTSCHTSHQQHLGDVLSWLASLTSRRILRHHCLLSTHIISLRRLFLI